MEPFQFDYIGYLRNMVFLIILMGILAYILVKLKSRQGGNSSNSPLASSLGQLFNSPARTEATHIEVLERKTLEPRKNVYLLRLFGDQYWLVGTTENQIEALGQIQPPTAPAYQKEQEQEGSGSFSDYLSQNEVS